MIKNISNLGDAAVYCDFGKDVNKETNSQVIKYFKSIKKENIDGINNLTPSYNKLIISYDLRQTNFNEVRKYIENLNILEVTSDKVEFQEMVKNTLRLSIFETAEENYRNIGGISI